VSFLLHASGLPSRGAGAGTLLFDHALLARHLLLRAVGTVLHACLHIAGILIRLRFAVR
jgi:hypothetical protein